MSVVDTEILVLFNTLGASRQGQLLDLWHCPRFVDTGYAALRFRVLV